MHYFINLEQRPPRIIPHQYKKLMFSVNIHIEIVCKINKEIKQLQDFQAILV